MTQESFFLILIDKGNRLFISAYAVVKTVSCEDLGNITPYEHSVNELMPMLEADGVSNADIMRMFSENPARF